MRILLLYPEFPDTFWSLKYAIKFIRKKAAFPPLGLLTIASLLPDRWSKRVVDVNVDTLTDSDLKWADFAFIGGMAIQRKSAEQIITRCKSAGLRVVAGGPLFTVEPDAFAEVDHLILDEAELTLPAFLEDLKKGKVFGYKLSSIYSGKTMLIWDGIAFIFNVFYMQAGMPNVLSEPTCRLRKMKSGRRG